MKIAKQEAKASIQHAIQIAVAQELHDLKKQVKDLQTMVHKLSRKNGSDSAHLTRAMSQMTKSMYKSSQRSASREFQLSSKELPPFPGQLELGVTVAAPQTTLTPAFMA